MTEDFMSETLPAHFTHWAPFAFAHPEEISVEHPESITGYAFTGLIRSTPLGPRFLVAPYEFHLQQIDPRDKNPIAPPEKQSTITRISAATRANATEVAFLQLESQPRFYTSAWMVVASSPEWIAEQLRSVHGNDLQIEIVDSQEIDWEETYQHIWF